MPINLGRKGSLLSALKYSTEGSSNYSFTRIEKKIKHIQLKEKIKLSLCSATKTVCIERKL